MQNTLNYKNYIGSVEFSEEDNILFGKVQGIRSLIMYEGTTIAELIADFHNSIDDYLEVCRANNEEPEKSFKGTFNVRVSPETHRNAAIFAIQNQKSLNKVVEEAIEYYLIQKSIA